MVEAEGGGWGVLSPRCASLAHTKPISSVGSGSALWRPLPLRPGVHFPPQDLRSARSLIVDLRDGRSPFVCTARYGPPLLRHSPSLLPTPLSSGERGGAFLQHIITSSQPLTRQNCASVAANHTRLHRRSHTNRSAGGSEP